MSDLIIDDGKLRSLPIRERLDKCKSILKNDRDESLRWDAVWLAGEIAEKLEIDDPLFNEVADLMAWVLQNDNNGVVKHEACYQIAARDMRKKIPDLIQAALYDKNIIAKHEALEALGLMRAFESRDLILKALDDPNPEVRETAAFVIKRLDRLQNVKDRYSRPKIL